MISIDHDIWPSIVATTLGFVESPPRINRPQPTGFISSIRQIDGEEQWIAKATDRRHRNVLRAEANLTSTEDTQKATNFINL
jgi:hypothetical protein